VEREEGADGDEWEGTVGGRRRTRAKATTVDTELDKRNAVNDIADAILQPHSAMLQSRAVAKYINLS